MDKDDILLYAAQHYQNRAGTTEEFLSDLNNINLINRSITKQKNGVPSNVRLLLNQIVMLSNAFGVHAATEMLLKKIPTQNHCILFPLLVFLQYLTIEQLSDHTVDFDQDIIKKLRELM